jgi:hypothetical protein
MVVKKRPLPCSCLDEREAETKTDDNYLTRVFRMGSLLMPTFDGECFHPVLNRRNIRQLSRRSQQPGHGESPVVLLSRRFPVCACHGSRVHVQIQPTALPYRPSRCRLSSRCKNLDLVFCAHNTSYSSPFSLRSGSVAVFHTVRPQIPEGSNDD